jgi:general secretion pathway protein K
MRNPRGGLMSRSAPVVYKGAPMAKQKGVALMIVIFVFALVSILSVGMYNRQSIFVQQAGNLLAQSQAYQYAIGSELFAKWWLHDDWDNDKNVEKEFFDDLAFLESSLTRPYEGAIVSSQFNDVQGKLNVNDLVKVTGEVNDFMKERFTRLFSRLSIETVKVDQMIDWLDENQETSGFDGAEDGDYLSLEPPYRNAGQALQDISELRLLPTISNEDYLKLIEHVTVLPRGWAPINVNTASAEVLQTLASEMSDGQADELISARKDKSWKKLDDFKSEKSVSDAKADFRYIGVRSDFYELATEVILAERTVRLRSLLYRSNEDGTLKVLSRNQGQKYLITKEQVAL